MVHRLARRVGGEVALFGGGTLLNDRGMLDEYQAVRQRTGRPVPIFGSGVSDPQFWSADTRWRDERDGWMAALADLPVVGVRGPRSKQLLDEAGATNVIVSGDPAVMLHAQTHSARPRSKKLSVGLNCGASSHIWGSAQVLNDNLSEVARALCTAGHMVEIVPVFPSDVETCRYVAARTAVRVLPAITSALSYIELMGRYDIVIAVKLHAAILAAVANVPFVMIEYQPKCRDFTASIGWERFTIRSDEAASQDILDTVHCLADRLPEHRVELYDNVCSLQRQFKLYCEAIRPLLLN
jgi:polysaccharide pyruvyl transferase WcaK-like protein